MKRVVAITVMLVMVTTLFAFSVFAETPVQPLQVITYSDTTTNVRISGTAERLHYNIDSFQVVFMNPPNNYGTACTPVLVSFRFYNSSDLPAYVGQAEFELTATTSTGSVNTIIYGYDQISTDLFVAESSYNTAEVGRIGIGASNDFAYYTGFVIPPRTSLYFSCIVYVNASAYGQNNTGATEDVNQVTLSSLNLYTNQISFSADYPYNNQPIDFSDVIQSISDLADTVSTSSEMQDLIDAITFTGSLPSYTFGNSTQFNKTFNTGLSGYTVKAQGSYSSPVLVDSLYANNPGDDTSVTYGTYRVYLKLIITEEVTLNQIRTRPVRRIDNLFDSTSFNNLVIDNIYSSIVDGIYFHNTGIIMNLNHNVNGFRYLNNGSYATIINMHYDYSYGTNFVIPEFNISNYLNGLSVVTSNVYAPTENYHILRDLYLSLVEDSATDNTEEAADMNNDIHEQEQVWYDNNSDALEAVGLSNYRFSQSQSSGIYTAVTQFQAVWNALGNWTNVYIFILILSISTYIIRHEPTTRVKQYRSSVQAERAERISYYARKNAEARANNGSTLKSVIRRRK